MFFVLLPPKEIVPDRVYGVISNADKPIWKISRCKNCNLIMEKSQINNLNFELIGENLCDFVWTDDDLLITSDLALKLQLSDLKGFHLREVDFCAWWQEDLVRKEIINLLEIYKAPELLQLEVRGDGGSVITSNMQIRSKCSVCGTAQFEPLQKGFSIDINQWDGSDIFRIKEFPGYILISLAFKEWLIKNSIKNYSIVPTTEFFMM